jgi:hypothetical protein
MSRTTQEWSGMAAFASLQVGLALAVAELMHAPEKFTSGSSQPEGEASFDLGRIFQQGVNMLVFIPSYMHSTAAGRP